QPAARRRRASRPPRGRSETTGVGSRATSARRGATRATAGVLPTLRRARYRLAGLVEDFPCAFYQIMLESLPPSFLLRPSLDPWSRGGAGGRMREARED